MVTVPANSVFITRLLVSLLRMDPVSWSPFLSVTLSANAVAANVSIRRSFFIAVLVFRTIESPRRYETLRALLVSVRWGGLQPARDFSPAGRWVPWRTGGRVSGAFPRCPTCLIAML